ncbi:uncharacterized protein LOC128554958 [Mercenaria mercenaria]|uniref:uncharacterized protein LOC128554958 n=1 Tax=Mercenaria mercenaria TaxID=6596 RepID=UPI00234EC9A1|nr:uncharacterized protein LOC128554958 [Mercenaria mercenaria]
MKVAQVAPIYKKKSTLDKGNYRPVSLLPVKSKIFERAIYTQLLEHFDGVFNHMLRAFMPKYGCNTTLRKISEDWKRAPESNMYLAAVLMDLSKAFDCLPQNLLLLKLQHYNVSEQSVSLIKSYQSCPTENSVLNLALVTAPSGMWSRVFLRDPYWVLFCLTFS